MPPAAVEFELAPRSFRALTGVAFDSLTDGQSIEIRAQLLAADPQAGPGALVPLTPFTSEAEVLSAPLLAGQADFVRFDVLFDLGDGVDGNTPLPALDFLRLPFRR